MIYALDTTPARLSSITRFQLLQESLALAIQLLRASTEVSEIRKLAGPLQFLLDHANTMPYDFPSMLFTTQRASAGELASDQGKVCMRAELRGELLYLRSAVVAGKEDQLLLALRGGSLCLSMLPVGDAESRPSKYLALKPGTRAVESREPTPQQAQPAAAHSMLSSASRCVILTDTLVLAIECLRSGLEGSKATEVANSLTYVLDHANSMQKSISDASDTQCSRVATYKAVNGASMIRAELVGDLLFLSARGDAESGRNLLEALRSGDLCMCMTLNDPTVPLTELEALRTPQPVSELVLGLGA